MKDAAATHKVAEPQHHRRPEILKYGVEDIRYQALPDEADAEKRAGKNDRCYDYDDNG